VLVGGSEILRDDSTRLAEKIQQAGGTVELILEPFMGHVYPAYAPAIPEAVTAVQQIADFIRKS
jgi:acetyl esterase/lipase